MSLHKNELKKWKKLLKNAVIGTVNVEINTQGKDTLINILSFLNGSMPKSDKHMLHQGHLAPKMMIQKVMKLNADLDLCALNEMNTDDVITLNDAPDEVITEIISGKLFKYIADLYVHSFFVLNKETIVAMVGKWDEIKGILNTVVDSQVKEQV